MEVIYLKIYSSAFAVIKNDGSVVSWGSQYDSQTYSSIPINTSPISSQLNGTLDATQIFSNVYAFATLRTDGSVVTWGHSEWGGNSSAIATQLNGTTDVTQIYSTSTAFAALRTDGSVVTWGKSEWGGDSSVYYYDSGYVKDYSVATQLDGSTDVTQVYSTYSAFAALRSDGSVVTWGNRAWGGESSVYNLDSTTITYVEDYSVATQLNGTIDVTQIYSTDRAFAALRADGSVVTWGENGSGGDQGVYLFDPSIGHTLSYSVEAQLNGTVDVTQICSSTFAFAALRADGSVVTWGNSAWGADSSAVANQLNGTIDVTQIFSTRDAFAALRADGSVVTWGDWNKGGNSSMVASQLDGTIDVIQIYSIGSAFAALRADGSVVTWGAGGDSAAVATALNGSNNAQDVTQIYSTGYAFAALRTDGSVVTWGLAGYGGDSSAVASQLDGTVDVTQIYSTDSAFAALRTDGSLVTWGSSAAGGNSSSVASQLTSGVVSGANIYTNDVFTASNTTNNIG